MVLYVLRIHVQCTDFYVCFFVVLIYRTLYKSYCYLLLLLFVILVTRVRELVYTKNRECVIRPQVTLCS